jgi:hypothetical protein
MQRSHPIRIWRGLAALLLALVTSGAAQAETQLLPFPSAPAWYLVSLQVEPDLADPLSVFPPGGGFEYEHIWSFDAVEGWRHFAPPAVSLEVPPGVLSTVNDLDRIEALRGYWIYVTSVPDAGFEIAVSGDTARVQRLTGAGWHAAGPLLAPAAAATNVDQVFADLGGNTKASIPELWSHAGGASGFVQIASFGATCTQSPEQCLTPGRGYWLRTTGDIALGKEFDVFPSAVLLSGRQPVQLVEIGYSGGSLTGVAGALRTDRPDSGLRFLPARSLYVDGLEHFEPDFDGGLVDGPAGTCPRDTDGDGEPDDLCDGSSDCVNLCFDNATQTHRVFVEMEPERLAALEVFSSLAPGHELAFLDLELAPTPETPQTEIVASVPLAVKPPVVTGEWSGFLSYEGTRARVPLHIFFDDCTEPSGGGAPDCDGSRLTAVINPTVLGDASNGLDDDRDGEVDEPSEDGALFGVREGLGFPSDVTLRGTISGGNALLRIEGDVATDAGLTDGVAAAFTGGARHLTLEGWRAGPTHFVGYFSDDWASPQLGRVPGRGTFELSRVVAGVCVVPRTDDARALGVECRTDTDCAQRCTGGARAGLTCDLQNADPSDDCFGATCEHLACSFRQLAGTSASANEYQALPITLDVVGPGGATPGALDEVIVELLGTGIRQIVSSDSFLLADVPCGAGPYELRISSPSCQQPQSVELADCTSSPGPIELVCDGPSRTGSGGGPVIAGGGVSLLGGPSSLGATAYQLEASSGGTCDGSASCQVRWEHDDGTPVAVVLSADSPSGDPSVQAVSGGSVSAGRDPFRGWSDRLLWPPHSDLRAGLLSLLPELSDEEL